MGRRAVSFVARMAAGIFALVTACVPGPRDAPGAHALDPPVEAPRPLEAPADPPPSVAAPAPEAPPTEWPSTPRRADLDPNNDFVVGPPTPVPDCEDRLRAAEVVFRRAELPLKTAARGTLTCGSEQVIQ